jgi:hypothetical protein
MSTIIIEIHEGCVGREGSTFIGTPQEQQPFYVSGGRRVDPIPEGCDLCLCKKTDAQSGGEWVKAHFKIVAKTPEQYRDSACSYCGEAKVEGYWCPNAHGNTKPYPQANGLLTPICCCGAPLQRMCSKCNQVVRLLRFEPVPCDCK